uniref:Uncharacterized protein n=1 Tax=Arundo donax TaxID=35708 RepID=A0A0A9BEK8_ARUDO
MAVRAAVSRAVRKGSPRSSGCAEL